jgi:hypothetical protein
MVTKMKTIKTLKNSIKYCVLVHKIHQERKKLNDARELLILTNNARHNGRMEVDDIMKPHEKAVDRKIYGIKREIVKKGLQKW